jgi:hypothetical protein
MPKFPDSPPWPFIVAIGVLRIMPPQSTLPWLHLACWIGLGALLVHALLARQGPSRRENALVVGALTLATILFMRSGRNECCSAAVLLAMVRRPGASCCSSPWHARRCR